MSPLADGFALEYVRGQTRRRLRGRSGSREPPVDALVRDLGRETFHNAAGPDRTGGRTLASAGRSQRPKMASREIVPGDGVTPAELNP